MPTAIKVENLSKQYRLGKVGTGTLRHDLNRWWHRVRGKEDPYLKIGDINDRTTKGLSDYVWALRDINFEILKGEAVGIIGRNGAGKSTLLKILSRTTAPTSGSVKIKGRVASLLEVGTGFHPELSGRDNIYLNGAILGMTRKEITSKFDQIVDFSGVERYIDTPVKRYSSGMYVRLAFAVAAHLESEILIVDEVLAVGDAEFQKKCLGKMGEVSKGEGRTILFVSHNMTAIKNLCHHGILLHHGTVAHIGTAESAISLYHESNRINIDFVGGLIEKQGEYNLGKGRFTKVFLKNDKSQTKQSFSFLEKIRVYFEYESLEHVENVIVSVVIKDYYGNSVLMGTPGDFYDSITIPKGTTGFSFPIEENLMPGQYFVTLGMAHYVSGSALDWNDEVISFKVDGSTGGSTKEYPWATIHGNIKPKSKIEIVKNAHK
jgi:lipopolysaccharide transport system ATP-binding protein